MIWAGRLWPRRPNVLLGRARFTSRLMSMAWTRPIRRGTGTPESGGITMREAQRLIRAFSGVDLIGGDVVEVSPPLDPSGMTSLNGATILFEILCLLSEQVVSSEAD